MAGYEPASRSASKGFFHTIPGIITGVAALITAVGGLILTLNQTGCFGARVASDQSLQQQKTESIHNSEATKSTVAEKHTSLPSSSNATAASNVSYSPTTIPVANKNVIFSIREAQVSPLSKDERWFKVKIKCVNESPYSFNFGSTMIRARIGEDKYTPDDSSPGPYYQTVNAQSFRIYEFFFRLPADANTFDIMIFEGHDTLGEATFKVS